jgi:hypothetical protein
MATRLVNITNISNQIVPILYGTIDAAKSNSTVDYTKSGTLIISPSTSIEIEKQRTDAGQLDQLKNKKIITVTER